MRLAPVVFARMTRLQNDWNRQTDSCELMRDQTLRCGGEVAAGAIQATTINERVKHRNMAFLYLALLTLTDTFVTLFSILKPFLDLLPLQVLPRCCLCLMSQKSPHRSSSMLDSASEWPS